MYFRLFVPLDPSSSPLSPLFFTRSLLPYRFQSSFFPFSVSLCPFFHPPPALPRPGAFYLLPLPHPPLLSSLFYSRAVAFPSSWLIDFPIAAPQMDDWMHCVFWFSVRFYFPFFFLFVMHLSSGGGGGPPLCQFFSLFLPAVPSPLIFLSFPPSLASTFFAGPRAPLFLLLLCSTVSA